MMLNLRTREELEASPEMKAVFEKGYASYEPSPSMIPQLQSLLHDIAITIVMGTWCGDSKLHVPHFYKILDEAGVTEKQVKLILVDGLKKAADGLIDDLHIERIPVFIFSTGGREIGRITERPVALLENDIIEILTKL